MFFLKTFQNSLAIIISTAAVVVLLAGISGAEENGAAVPDRPAADVKTLPGQAMSVQPAQPDRITAEYVNGYLTDSGRMLVSPAKWDGGDWTKAALVIGATTGLYFADSGIRDFARRNQDSIGDNGATIGNVLGNPLFAAPSLGLFYLYGHLNQDPKARRASLLAVESLVISGAATLTIKLATQRPRPFSGEDSTTWNGPSFRTTDPAFPSVHAQTAFSIASVLAEEYGNNPYVPPIAYGLATLVGFSRIYDDKHWASDVFLGAAIGYFIGKTVVFYHSEQGNTAVTILPAVSRQGFGLTAEYRF